MGAKLLSSFFSGFAGVYWAVRLILLAIINYGNPEFMMTAGEGTSNPTNHGNFETSSPAVRLQDDFRGEPQSPRAGEATG